ncbi:MAG: AEC family transporter [Verrucomicrobiales bacterium]
MLSYSTILIAIIPVFLVVGAGFFMQRRDWIGGEAVETGVMKLGLNVLIPCFILSVVPGNPALATALSASWAMGTGFVVIVIGFTMAFLIGRLARMKRGEGARTFTLATGIQNYGYLPLPIMAELFPNDPGPQGLILVHGLGVELAVWTIGVSILAGKANLKAVLNGPFIATVVALILNFTGLHEFIPKIAQTFFGMMGVCAIPMAIFMIGATMSRFFEAAAFRRADTFKTVIVSCIVRLGIMAAIIMAIAIYLPMPEELKRVMVVQAAMPAAIFPIVVVRLYGGHPATAIQVVLATSIVSIGTAPLIIALGMKWIGVEG